MISKPDRRNSTAQALCGSHGGSQNAAARLPNVPSSCTKGMRRRAGLVAAVCGYLLAPEMAFAQQPSTQTLPQVVPLTAQGVHQGWRASDVLGDGVLSGANDELGTVKNILIGRDGRIEALIVESVRRPDVPEFVFRIPWNRVVGITDPDHIVADIPLGQRQQFGLDPDRRDGAVSSDQFPVTEIIGDYARLQAGQAYGYVSDVVFTKDGRMLAVLVTRDGVSSGGTYAFGFPREPADRWSATASYYGLPYVTQEHANAAAVRIDATRFGDGSDRSGGRRSQAN
ncbi:PRC-barrel domain-containing protein [Bradyrhizobium sp.]|uniref:PRC-barrel domain-containing protein n=1 Tax=Bradyrhizobium sp. TaxID=376 RepID=UPI0025C07A83|nr:PRC-barrel domain-containing protein [Bradyrhizobium sp.]